MILNISNIKSSLPTPDDALATEITKARTTINAEEKQSGARIKDFNKCTVKTMQQTTSRIANALNTAGIKQVYVGRFKTIYTRVLKRQLDLFDIEMKYFPLPKKG